MVTLTSLGETLSIAGIELFEVLFRIFMFPDDQQDAGDLIRISSYTNLVVSVSHQLDGNTKRKQKDFLSI